MNMTKVGMQSHVHLFENTSAMHCNHYTLCEVQDTRTRNGSRYGFAFNISRIRRTTLISSLGDLAGVFLKPALDFLKSPTASNTSPFSLKLRLRFNTPQSPQSLTGCSSQADFFQKQLFHLFLTISLGLRGVFCPVSGGCHE